MAEHLAPLLASVHAAATLWTDDAIDAVASGSLVSLNAHLARAQRLLDAARAVVAAEIARRSRPELGADGLAKMQGFRNPVAMISAVTGTPPAEAARLVKIGEATAPRATISGEPLPARHPHIAAALAAGRIGAHAAGAMVAMLDRLPPHVDREARERAERLLADSAPGLAGDALGRLLLRVQARLDSGGVARREDEMRAERALHIHEDAQGRLILRGVLDPEHAAPVKLALEAAVGARLRAQRDEGEDAERPSIPQLQADALALLATHALGCDNGGLPFEGATVVVRIDLADLESGDGSATIDGLSAPISVATARRMAAGGAVIPCVLGGDSEILDWGREKRLFTRAQKLALVERDGGCASCGAPPSHTKVHHLRWWARDAGPTDLANGILLCESCHHRVHDNGWEIRIDGVGVRAQVWFVPPPWVDAARTPRLGGRARYAFAA